MGADRPLVSVIIPHHDDVDTLASCLASALNQTLADLEVVLVDDASSEPIEVVVRDIRDSRLRFFRHDFNRGAAAARNTGIKEARGRFIAFLDADDTWEPTKLERQLEALRLAGDRGLASCCSYHLLRPDGRLELHRPPLRVDWHRYLLWGCDLSPGSTLVVEASIFDDIGLFDDSLRRLEDWDWLLRFTSRFEIVSVVEPLARINAGASPKNHVVMAALQRISDKHLPAAAARGWRFQRQFRAALWLERSAVAYRDGRSGLAALRLLWSLFLFPRRNKAFYARMLQRLSQTSRLLLNRMLFR